MIRWEFTLPDLQEKLDRLVEGSMLQISMRDYERLFGSNDVARARLRNFAKAHDCVTSHSDSTILFRKGITQRSDEPQL